MNTSFLGIIKHEIINKAIKYEDFIDDNGIQLEKKVFCYNGLLLPLFVLRIPFAFVTGLVKAIIAYVYTSLFRGYIYKGFYTSYFRKGQEGHLVTLYDVFQKERNRIQKQVENIRKNSDNTEDVSGFLYEEVEIL